MKTKFLVLLSCVVFCGTAFSQQAKQIDAFERLSCDDYLSRMDSAIAEASNNPLSTVYILIYEVKEVRYNSRKKKDEMVFPNFGSAKAKIDSIKKYLSLRKSPIKNLSFIEAGFRENSMVEIWLVPKDASPPKPTPTLNKMRYRKGRASGFCTDCC